MSIFIRSTYSMVALAIALIPVWLYVGARSLLSPEGFFQEFFVFGAGVFFLGTFQIVLLFALLFVLFFIWSD